MRKFVWLFYYESKWSKILTCLSLTMSFVLDFKYFKEDKGMKTQENHAGKPDSFLSYQIIGATSC